MSVKLLTEHYLEFLSLKGGSSESTLVKIPHCWKSHVTAQLSFSTAPPSYAESAMGRVNTKEDQDDEHTTGNSDFAPVYTYYNWEKKDPATHFTVQMDEADPSD